MSITPVFIGGCDRSGTTLLGSLLGGPLGSVATPEAQFMWSKFFQGKEAISEIDMYENLEQHWRFKIWGVKEFDKNLLARKEEKRCIVIRNMMEKIILYYANKNHKKTTVDFWINHTPANLKHCLQLKHIYPESKFVHIVRDGRAVFSSFKSLDWGPDTAHENAHFWTKQVCFGLAAQQFIDKSHFATVKYEELLLNPEATLRRLCFEINIEYDDAMLQGRGFAIPSYTAEQHKEVGKSINSSRIMDWTGKLSKREIEIYESETGDLLGLLGYARLTDGGGEPYNKSDKLAELPIFLLKLIRRYRQKFRRWRVARDA